MMTMNKNDSESRAGEQYRSNPDRFFHVMTQGWYVFTREGIRGPFLDRKRAATFLESHITDSKDEDPSSSWRL